jgi:hypothetical protein
MEVGQLISDDELLDPPEGGTLRSRGDAEVQEMATIALRASTMGGIADEHVEWAVVNRLKAMLDVPPPTKFNVTQAFALFSAMLLWTKRTGVGADHGLFQPADRAARAVRKCAGSL